MSEKFPPAPRAGLLDLPPYIPGKSGVAGMDRLRAKLSANESPLGASPAAVEAYLAQAGSLASYPDSAALQLREALARTHGLDGARIVVGAGSDELLHLLAEAYLSAGDSAVMSEFGFLIYPIATKAAGADIIVAPDTDHVVSVDAMLAAVTKTTKIVWLANPNNPTGTYLPAREVARLHAGLPEHVMLVIDNAYAEYVTAPDFAVGSALVERANNVVMVRTFSKMGLAALRVGWMYAPPAIVDVINRVRGPFNVSAPAQAAATAATLDVDFTAQLQAHNAQWRDWLTHELSSNRVRVLPSQGNFVLALFERDGVAGAAAAFAALAREGIIVREMAGYNLPHALRISIGQAADMQRVAEILAGLEEARS